MRSHKRRSTRLFWRRPIAAVSFQCQILSTVVAAILFLHEVKLDRQPDAVHCPYLLAGADVGRQPRLGITIEEDEKIVPGPPGFVKITHHGELHEIHWQGTRDDTILGYQIYRRCPREPWQRIGFVALRKDDPRNAGLYKFKDHFSGNCDYTVAAVGPNGQPGPKSVDIH